MEEKELSVEALQAENEELKKQLQEAQLLAKDKERLATQYCEWWERKCDELKAIKADVAAVEELLKRFSRRW